MYQFTNFKHVYQPLCIFSFSVPVRGPKLLSLKSTTTSMHLKWAPIPQQYVNGILRGYKVIFFRLPSNRDRRILSVNALTLSVEVPGLRRNTTYGVQLVGFTRVRGIIRNGKRGPVHNITTKFGKEAMHFFVCFSVFSAENCYDFFSFYTPS